jgi:hypothetical protein
MHADTNIASNSGGRVVPWNKGKLLGQKPPLKRKRLVHTVLTQLVPCGGSYGRHRENSIQALSQRASIGVRLGNSIESRATRERNFPFPQIATTAISLARSNP